MKLLSKTLDLIPSWSFLQRFYKILHTISIRGMNYGGSGKFETSGEINVIKFLNNCFENSTDHQLIVFDVGANNGMYTKILLRHLPEIVQIFSFEPAKSTFNNLKANLRETTVQCFQVGFGEETKKLKLYHAASNSQASLFDRNPKDKKSYEVVDIRSLDSFCSENQIEKIDFLKLDIEGNELNALKGASELIQQKKIYFIQFEFGGTNIDSKVFFRDFWRILENYQLYRIIENGLFPIKNYDESLEIFYYSNYFAVLK